MTGVLGRRPDIGHHLVARLGLQRPIIELIYLTFLGSAIGGIVGGTNSAQDKPLVNLAQMLLILGVFVPRFLLTAPTIYPLLKKPPAFQFYILMSAILVPVRFALGFINGSPRGYLLSDMALALTMILIYLVSRSTYERQLPISDTESFRTLVPIVLLVFFVGFLPVPVAHPSFPVAIMGAVLILLLAASRKPAWQALFGFILLGLYTLAVPRGFVLAIGFSAILIAFSNIFWRTILGGIVVIATLGTYAVLNYQDLPFLPRRVAAIGLIVDAGKRIDWSKVTFDDALAVADVSPSIHQRIWEAQQSVDALNKAGPFAWIFGLGYGTSLDMSNAPDSSVRREAVKGQFAGAGLVHNVHLILFEQLLRFGLLGLAIFLWLGWRMITVYRRCRRIVMRDRRITFDFLASLALIGCYINFQFESDWDNAFVAFGLLGYLDARFEYSHQVKQARERSMESPRSIQPQLS